MALINCPECGKEISDKASVCIHCGCPISPKKAVVNNANDNIRKGVNGLIAKIKRLSRKAIIIFSAIIMIVVVICCIPSGAEQDKAVLKGCLLEPESLIIYSAYTNENYNDEGRATLFYFGAKNRGGGISDDWALVHGDDIWFESDFNDASESGDSRGVLDNAEVVYAKFALDMGHEEWRAVKVK